MEIGKKIGGYHYIHKSALDSIRPEKQELVKELETYIPADFDYDILAIGKDSVHFIQSPDWDTNYEPTVGDRFVVSIDGTVRFKKGQGQIYHRRHLFVKSDYRGFDINDDIQRVEWWNKHNPDRNRMGYRKYWNNFLKDINKKERIMDIKKITLEEDNADLKLKAGQVIYVPEGLSTTPSLEREAWKHHIMDILETITVVVGDKNKKEEGGKYSKVVDMLHNVVQEAEEVFNKSTYSM